MNEETATAFAAWLVQQGVERAYERPLLDFGLWVVDAFKDGDVVWTIQNAAERAVVSKTGWRDA